MKKVSHYQLEDKLLGEGGMGRVYKGTDTYTGNVVAVKEILPEFAADLEYRFRTEHEVELLQQLDNPSVVKVFDRFPYEGNFYIVMEFVEGLNVEQYIQAYGAIPEVRACRFMMKILETMQYVHERRIVHRDMKPNNIMLRPDDSVCILDFGIAKDMNASNVHTMVGSIIGSDGYMSPEQADGFSIDHRADIYALGCVLYYMLTGHHAYPKLGSDFETEESIRKQAFPRLSKHSKTAFKKGLQEILDHATDKNMMRRYQSCREFYGALSELVCGTSIKPNPSAKQPIMITVGRMDCDIIVDDPFQKVSRCHLEITYRQFTGGQFYVINDRSSNGTMVNGHMMQRGESVNIPAEDSAPFVYLAGDSAYTLDWNEVRRLIAKKVQETSMVSNDEDPAGPTLYSNDISDCPVPSTPSVPEPDNDDETKPDISFIDAIRLFFVRCFDFSGRSRRKEYWYAYLFTFLLYLVIMSSCLWMDHVSPDDALACVAVISFLIVVPNLALTVRRLHDIGKSGLNMLWLLLGFIPLVGIVMSIIWIIWLATDSEKGENKWGPCPK